MNAAKDENFYVLALDGGGARGIYPAQILACLENRLSRSIGSCFDLIAGTSTCSIIAGAAAAGVEMQAVVDLFEKRAPDIFSRKRFGWGLFRSKYARQPLERLVEEYLPPLRLEEISIPLLITSADISTGDVRVFKSRYLKDQGEEYVRDGKVPLIKAILASCAAPSFFDPMKVDEYLLADGGMWANNPSILAVVEAVSKFRRSLSQIHILSIGTGKPSLLYEQGRYWGILTGWEHLNLVSYLRISLDGANIGNSRRYVRSVRFSTKYSMFPFFINPDNWEFLLSRVSKRYLASALWIFPKNSCAVFFVKPTV